MIKIRNSDDRGRYRLDWLDSRLSFSFADFHDPDYMGFRALRVINDDLFAPGQGFPTHPHQDMEIVTYVIDGAVEHKDSVGSAGIIAAGDVQRMSAGTGIRHSEYNPSDKVPLRLLQIWILPDREGLAPGYEQQTFRRQDKSNALKLLVSPDGRDGSLTIHQDVELYASILEPGETLTHALKPGRHAWLQVASGSISANGQTLAKGDGAAVSGEAQLNLTATSTAEFLLFDLA